MNSKSNLLDFIPENLVREISDRDEMLNKKRVDGLEHYFRVGESAIDCIRSSFASVGKSDSSIQAILDFPCGHGRVLRYLKSTFPNARIVACDLLRDGVDFCANKFGAEPIYSHRNPSKIKLPVNYFDLIWIGSLFTHFEERSWLPFLAFFSNALRSDGVLIFSTHGAGAFRNISEHRYNYGLSEKVLARISRNYLKNGFGYTDYHFGSRYGISLSTPQWIEGIVARCPNLKLISIAEIAYDNHQDIVTCVKGDI